MAAAFDRAALEAVLDGVTLEPESREAVDALDEADIARIDAAILKALGREWKKAGFIASGVMIAAPDEHEDLPEAVYTYRIRALVQAKEIEAQGDPAAMKTFEIRLPA